MNEALKLKKKYNTARGQLFDNLISNNDGFIFNNHHTKLVDDIVRDIVQSIIKEYSIDGFALIAVGGYGRNDLSFFKFGSETWGLRDGPKSRAKNVSIK